jgi:hypothetical protein
VSAALLRNINREVLMAKFGRFGFGKKEPGEIFEGDRMKVSKNLTRSFLILKINSSE